MVRIVSDSAALRPSHNSQLMCQGGKRIAHNSRPRTWKKTTNSVGKPLHSTSVGVAIFFSLIFSYLQRQRQGGQDGCM